MHLSSDRETAVAVGLRKSPTPVVLAITAAEATVEGVVFYVGNDRVWLADAVPARFVRVADEGPG